MEYWLIIDEKQQGPFTPEQLAGMEIDRNTPVWRDGLPDWLPAGSFDELANMLPPELPLEAIPEAPDVPAAATVDNTPDVATPPVVPTQAVIYAPADAIPAGYVAVAATGEKKSPPTYLVWAILSTVICFLPLGVCAIICALKVKKHYSKGDIVKAYKLSERTALFICLSIVAWLIWMPFSVVFAMF